MKGETTRVDGEEERKHRKRENRNRRVLVVELTEH